MQLFSNEDFDQVDKGQIIPGFSFFGKRDLIQKHSVASELEARKSGPLVLSHQSWVQELSPNKLNLSNRHRTPSGKKEESTEFQ